MNDWSILEVLPLGIVVIDTEYCIVRWNRWMEVQSDKSARQVQGRNLLEEFPNLNSQAFLRNCRSVFTFGNVIYLSQRLHRYLFPFPYRGSDGSGIKWMQQSATMTPVRDNDEVTHVAITVEDVTASVILEKQLRTKNRTDSLTGALNRRFLETRLPEELDRHRRYHRTLSVLMLDIDRFKEINDTQGHRAGDVVLKRLCSLTRGVLRSIDHLVRYGGEEFLCLLPETEGEEARMIAERLRATVEESDTGITVSVGVAYSQSGDDTPEALVQRADMAMYAAKRAGRNRVVCSPR